MESYPVGHQGSPDSDNVDRSVISASTLYPPLIILLSLFRPLQHSQVFLLESYQHVSLGKIS